MKQPTVTETDIADAGPDFAQRVNTARRKNGSQIAPKPRTRPAAPPTPPIHQTVIVAHTSRSQWATALAHATDGHLCIDNGRLGCTKNHLAAWKHHAENTHTKWSLVIEDDALPIDDFTDQVRAALTAAPTPIVALYLGKQRPPQHQPGIAAAVTDAVERDHAWIIAPRAYHAVATAIKTELVRPFLRIAGMAHHSNLDIDEAITEWLRYDGHLISYTMPSLVEHRDEATIAKHRDSAPRPAGRKAWHVGTRDNWQTPATVIS